MRHCILSGSQLLKRGCSIQKNSCTAFKPVLPLQSRRIYPNAAGGNRNHRANRCSAVADDILTPRDRLSDASNQDEVDAAAVYDASQEPEIEDMLRKWERGELTDAQVDLHADLTPEARQMLENRQRKAAVIMDLIRAGGTLEERLKHHEKELDGLLLQVLEARAQAARELGEPREAQEVLKELYSVLRNEVERVQASAALRLLDGLLDMLGDDIGTQEYEERKEQCMVRMQEAFTGHVGAIDIFRAAAAFATREAVALEEFQVERVRIEDFKRECKELHRNVARHQAEVRRQLQVAEVKLQRLRTENPRVLDRPDMQQQLLVFQQAQEGWRQRNIVLQQLEDVALLAEDLESHQMMSSSRR